MHTATLLEDGEQQDLVDDLAIGSELDDQKETPESPWQDEYVNLEM